MPESRSRRKKKSTYTPPTAPKAAPPSPAWWAPTMVAVMILGLVWVVVYYLSQARFPIGAIHNWNLAVGFGLILGGFAMTARWR
ncbi:MAG: cell division protein CrgA [Bifidobacteriaceae bacterium]|nr:cell division protein CrgA [Bifidobacteriaceae bacterium]